MKKSLILGKTVQLNTILNMKSFALENDICKALFWIKVTGQSNLFVASPSVNGRSRLVIDNAMKRDDGTYMCIAKNIAGERRALAAVRVKGIICHLRI